MRLPNSGPNYRAQVATFQRGRRPPPPRPLGSLRHRRGVAQTWRGTHARAHPALLCAMCGGRHVRVECLPPNRDPNPNPALTLADLLTLTLTPNLNPCSPAASKYSRDGASISTKVMARLPMSAAEMKICTGPALTFLTMLSHIVRLQRWRGWWGGGVVVVVWFASEWFRWSRTHLQPCKTL